MKTFAFFLKDLIIIEKMTGNTHAAVQSFAPMLLNCIYCSWGAAALRGSFADCRFTPAISSINGELDQLASVAADMHFVDCGRDFTEGSHSSHEEGCTSSIHASLMPDGVNLNAAGMEQLASCLQPVIRVSGRRCAPSKALICPF